MRVVNCVPIVRTGSVTVMARDIGLAFRHYGLEVADLEYHPGQKVPRALPRLLDWLSRSPDGGLLVDINGVVANSNLVARAMRERPDTFNCFTFMTDTPLLFNDRLRKWPAHAIVGYVDRSFSELVEFMAYQRPDFIFYPHGGPPAAKNRLSTAEREIEVLFVGNVGKVAPPTEHAATLYGDDAKLITLFAASLETTDPVKTPFQIVRETAALTNAGYSRNNIALVATHLEIYLSNISRLRVLSSLNGFGVTVVGSIADGAFGPATDIQSLGFQPFNACVDLMRRAKVLLNIVPSFPNGGHERPFYALSQGTAVMTTRSSFLEADQRAHGFIEFFDIARDDIGGALRRLNSDLDRGTMDREAMLRDYEQRHTWKQRAEPLLARAGEKFS